MPVDKKRLIIVLLLLASFCTSLASGQVQKQVVKSGDTVTIVVWERESLSGSFIVDSSGKIALPPPIGQIPVSGLTATQITDRLKETLKEYVLDPTVFVAVHPMEGFIVHVLGEVVAPSPVRITEGTTLQEALTNAGGLTPLADVHNIQIFRKQAADIESGSVTHKVVDFSQFQEFSLMSGNPPLQADDVIIVPRIPEAERDRAIYVMGAVRNPGILMIPMGSDSISVMDAFVQSGGNLPEADLENLLLLRSENERYVSLPIDLKLVLDGQVDTSDLPRLFPGDILTVPEQLLQDIQINVVGQVLAPGVYSVPPDTRLFDAIYRGGGFAEEAAIDRVLLIRVADGKVEQAAYDLGKFLASEDLSQNPVLKDRTTVFVPVSADSKRIPSVYSAFVPSMRVTVLGEVTRPETYQVAVGVNLLDVFKLAGGSTTAADLERVILLRNAGQPEALREEVNLDRILTEGTFELLPVLQSNDTVIVPRQKPTVGLWRTIVNVARDVSTVVLAVLLIVGRR